MDRLQSEDWIKVRTWDVRLPSGAPVETVEQMRHVFIGITDKQLKDRLHLPSSQAMPKALRKEIIAL